PGKPLSRRKAVSGCWCDSAVFKAGGRPRGCGQHRQPCPKNGPGGGGSDPREVCRHAHSHRGPAERWRWSHHCPEGRTFWHGWTGRGSEGVA
ncbi:unnamed protein product, partial [Discosporangium mesarthrocarpum]